MNLKYRKYLRGYRILELFQAEHLDEDLKDDDKADDSSDSSDEKEPDLEEYQSSTLTFQERSLRQYFKDAPSDADGDKELRTPAPEAHLMILAICVDTILEAAKDPENWKAADLRSYATLYWDKHLKELEADSASDETVKTVIELLHRVLINTNNVAKLFEQYMDSSSQYPPRPSDLTKSSESPEKEHKADGPSETPWYDHALAWIKRGLSLPNTLLGSEIQEWCSSLDETAVLMPLAKGHFKNWLERDDSWWLTESFRFTKDALKRVSFPFLYY